jgi:hypothetical protein
MPLSNATLINPRLAIDPTVGSTGKLYVVYQGKLATAPAADKSVINLQSSTDGGQTWSLPVTVNDDPGGTGVSHGNPWVAVGAAGRVFVIWFDGRHSYSTGGTLTDIYSATSTDGGATFSPNRRVTDRSINVSGGIYGNLGTNPLNWYGPTLLPLSDGGVLAAWADSREGNLDNGFQDIYLSRLDPGAGIARRTISTASTSGLSVVLSRLAYPGGPEAAGVTTPVTKVVVANDNDAAAALAGAVLARANWGPLLLSPAGGLPAVVKAEAARVLPEGGFVIGDSTSLSPAVSSDLTASTRNGENVQRVAPAAGVALPNRPAELARLIAELLRPLPGTSPEAVIANPGTPDAASASALAAALRLPILFVDSRTTLPPPTAAAISSLGIKKALIVGGGGSVNTGVEGALGTLLGAGNVRRLDGADQYAVSNAVLTEAKTRGLPANVVYVADGNRPIDGALLGASVARLGGMMLLTPLASSDAAEATLGALGVDAAVDRLVGVVGTGGTDPTLPPPPQHSVKVSLAGSGSGKVTGSGIACPGSCLQSYASGTAVSLTATPAPGSKFLGWSGNCGGTGACNVTASADANVTATFGRVAKVAPKCTLSVKNAKVALKQPKKGKKVALGTLTLSARCNQNASVTLTGLLTEAIGKKPKHGKQKTRQFKLGPIKTSVRANVSKAITVKLPSGALDGLGKNAKESVAFTLTGTNASGRARATAKIASLKSG